MCLVRARRVSGLLGLLLFVGGSAAASPAVHRCPHHDPWPGGHESGACTCPGPCEGVAPELPAAAGVTWTGPAPPRDPAPPADGHRVVRPSPRYLLPPSTAPPSPAEL